MNLEQNLEFLNEKRKKYHSIRSKQGIIYSGIKSLDDLTNGFDRQKIYSFVAKKGNGLYSLVSTIAENIDVLYQTNYSVITGKGTNKIEIEDYWHFMNNKKWYYHKIYHSYNHKLQKPFNVDKPILLIAELYNLSENEILNVFEEVKKWNRLGQQVLVLALSIIDDESSEPLTLDEIPNHIKMTSDVIISLYRPEYYKIETWKNGEPTENQIEISLLKHHNETFSSEKLYFDKENKRIKSIKKPVLPKSLTNRMIKILNEETI